MSEHHETYPPGTPVIALDGTRIGVVRHGYPNYVTVAETGTDNDLIVPVHAIDRVEDGAIHITINRGALDEAHDQYTYERRQSTDGS